MMDALSTGLAVGTGPFGLTTALGSLALSDFLGREPSFNLGPGGTLSALAQALGLTSPAAATPGLATANVNANLSSPAANATGITPGSLADIGFFADPVTTANLADLTGPDLNALNALTDISALTDIANTVNTAAANPAAAAAEAAGAAAAANEGVTSTNTADDTGFGGFGGVSAAGMGGFGETGAFGDMGGGGFGGATASANADTTDTGGDTGGEGEGEGEGVGGGEGEGGGGDDGGDGGDGGGYAQGGLVAFANGGLVPLANGGKIAIGPGGGLDDLIPTSINGRRAAALSDGEFVIPADVVSMLGDGSSNAGARRFYDLVKQVRQTKTGTARQAGPLPVGDILKRSLA
jgi:hypothetical protein